MRALLTTSILAGVVALSGCTTDPTTGQRSLNKAAIGAGIGAIAGAGVAYSNADKDKMGRAAAIGAILGGGTGLFLDKKEAKLREELDGSGIDITRTEDGIDLVMPGNITFATNDATLNPNFYSTLDRLASVLTEDNQTGIVVAGYTDSTGNDSINVPLSQRRAASVANYLQSRGVSSAKIRSQGYGAQSPIASNNTASGRSQNRRVEVSVFQTQ